MAEDKLCALAEVAVLDVTPPWPPCSGKVSAVRVFYREGGERVQALWKALAAVRDASPSADFFLCEGHIHRVRTDGLRVS